ncbi:SMI1/KNR4 family protein [Luteolibacter arcticus]|uniref:SMI1/KNR4 family protein n=1 Tax=Luteolibacter arcticus TaxID=1581411 RepID=A0ABT3GG77_9BACT|nr:SMI1/KNR4 family protein [Luteolibacter arcticus]MCW1922619.1 SMI1/KNR4 family protein [Luteolibacter arcticus]
MSDFEVVILMAVLAIPAIGLIWLVRRMRAPFRKRRDELAVARYRERLAAPDFAAMEAHFGVELPAELKAFYRQPLLEKSATLRLESGEWDIDSFEAIDGESPREAWPGCESYVAIANDGCGNRYLFDPKQPGRGVFFHDHEIGEFPVVDSLRGFLMAIEASEGWRE